jgi:hypothetical protein
MTRPYIKKLLGPFSFGKKARLKRSVRGEKSMSLDSGQADFSL